MQRKIAILGLVAVAGLANAQSFYDSFDAANYAGSPPAGGTVVSVVNWTTVNNSTGGAGTTGWFQGTLAAANSGPNYIAANYNTSTGSNGVSNWLMSPVRTFQNGDTISFFSRSWGGNPATYPDRLYLKLSLNGASTNPGDFATVLVTINGGLSPTGYPNTWTPYSATLTGLGGPTSGRFAFHYSTNTGGPLGSEADYIGIDDVRYSAVPEPATMAALGLGAAALIRRRRK